MTMRQKNRSKRTKRCTPSCGSLRFTLYSVARRNRVIAAVMQHQRIQLQPRSHRIFPVLCSLCALVLVSLALTHVENRANQEHAGDVAFLEWLDREYPLVHVADIPSPIMFPDESQPILSMLSDHDIMWSSGGSLSHSLSVSKNRVADARQLIQEHFPDIQLVPIADAQRPPQMN